MKLGEAAQVAEHDRRLAAHAAEPHALGVGQHLVDDGLGHEARERVARLLALERHGQPVDRQRVRRMPAITAATG